jgi:hypothetical protein
MNLRRLLTVCSLIGLAACSPQNPASVALDNSSAQKPQSSPTVDQPSPSILQHDGCTIDIAKVCQSFIDQPQFMYNGDKYDWHRFQQSFSRHPDVEIWARYPDGNVVADIECHVDSQNRKINWARLLPNPPLNDKSWDFAKSKRWCQEDSPDYSGWAEYWRSENSASN